MINLICDFLYQHGVGNVYTYSSLFLFGILVAYRLHTLTDHHEQGSFVSDHKCHSAYWMWYHTTNYAAAMSAWLFIWFGVPLWSFPIFLVSHYLIDHYIKCHPKFVDVFKTFPKTLDWFDLLCHLTVILALIGITNI
jgi:hypothetical protein